MSATTPTIAKQQELAKKKTKDLKDDEKVFLLKREIDKLRSQIRETGVVEGVGHVGPDDYQPSSSSSMSINDNQGNGFCSSGFCRMPLLTIFIVLGVAMVARWKRRRGVSSTIYRRAAHTMPEISMQFELQDAHETPSNAAAAEQRDYSDYRAPESAQIQFV